MTIKERKLQGRQSYYTKFNWYYQKESEWEKMDVLQMSMQKRGANLITLMLPNYTMRVSIPEGVEVLVMEDSFIDHIDLPSTIRVLTIVNTPFLKEIHLPKNIKEVNFIDNHIDIVNLDEILKSENEPDITMGYPIEMSTTK